MDLLTELESLIPELEKGLDQASSLQEMEALRVEFLGRKGRIARIMSRLPELEPAQRPLLGQTANRVKESLTAQFEAKKTALDNAEEAAALARFDAGLPGRLPWRGSLHPVTMVMEEICTIFKGLGYDIVSGPEVETDYYCFEALNIPPEHPARDMQDTYYLSNGQLLKTHTSAAQNTILRKYAADLEKGIPLRAVFPGRCFRNEKIDACHENTFFQMEGMMVDKDISISNLIYFMKTMLSEVFQKDVTVRLRPGFFPFVEPGFELDIQCLICGGEGCSSCKDSGWLELCPCGMIHPNVLKAGGIDPEKYSGFAFGLGLTRLAMMKYGVKDIRVFNSCNLKSLSQFTNSSFTVPDDTKKEEA